ncbi:S53 family peptidase [Actinacidiphila paucisporea]|uniref:Pro-kumamolisin, activation domain n=1 Tax=Actinacidiphila paucisporea TaxID=310782 RepID=A0A1M6Z4M1_9ACTN|nr:protease pro-enzyme activation domain-containing protein [Actinacidiphila paucisporea]SHL25269.1 Pro-kumamolisin, activation domain [Actinacidiphila paucisporea]
MGISAREEASLMPRGAVTPSRRRTALFGGVVAATAVAMIAATAPAAMADTAPAAPLQRLGATPTLPHGAVRTGTPADSTALDLSVVLAPRDPAALTKFVTDVSTPGSPLYHHYLKTGEFGPTFGPAAATVQKVRGALQAQGLHPGALAADGMTVPLHTTVGAAAKAFRTGFTSYRTADGRTAVSNTAAPAVEGDVASSITAVTGLSTLSVVKPHYTAATKRVVAPKSTAGGTAQPHMAGKTPALCSSISSLLSQYGLADTRDYWSAGKLASTYGMANEPNVGTGVTVGIFELENYSTKDIAAYQSCYGTKVPVSAVKVDGGPKYAADADLGYGVESALDIEDVIGLVPQASVVVYQGVDAENATWQNVLNVYNKMVTDNRAQVISTSWGGCEPDTPASFMDAENAIFQRAAAQGQTVTAASGDNGSADCWYDVDGDGVNDDPHGTSVATDDPASQPYVLGVGGTSMTGSESAAAVWNSLDGATGGGVSQHFALDATTGYQAGVNGPGYADGCAAGATGKCRQVPDVSALADPLTGYLLANGQDDTGGQYWTIIGGTSGASPTWAALIAQADLDLSCQADGPVGFVNPALYKLPATAFRDITSGSNYLSYTGVPSGDYSAAAGYDLTTGRGTPHARSIIPTLCKSVAQQPAGTFTSVNPARILDTRYAIGRTGTTPVAANSAVSLQIAGSVGGTVPASGVTAVVLNVTATAPTATGHLTAYPGGTTRPTSSNLNWLKGQTIPNLVIVPVGADGKVNLYNASSGTVHFVADVFGYYSTATGGATYNPVGPARVLDTRSKIGVGTTKPVAANSAVELTVAGAGGVPATGATAVVLNVTATAPTATGHLIAYPSGTTRPSSSNINWLKGQTTPNLVVLPLGANGKVDLYNASNGTVHFVADVFGYYSTATGGTSFHAAGPSRVLDTRYGVGAPKVGPLTSTGSLSLNLADGNVLANAKAVVLNVTVADSTSGGVLTVWPDGKTLPTSSNLNWTKGQIVANLVTVPVVNGKIDFHVNAGSVDVIADLFGYYTS